jgi:heme exporter protein D
MRDDLLPGFGTVQLPTFLLAALLSLVVAAVWVGASLLEHQALLAEELQWRATESRSLEQLNQFRQQFPALDNENQLTAVNLQLASQLQTARETYSGLANQIENAIEGFHAPLVHLADHDLEGLWLDSIALIDGQRFFTLDGFVRNPELIPQYLDQLGQSSFGGISIDQLMVAKSTDRANLWRFTLSNQRKLMTVEQP